MKIHTSDGTIEFARGSVSRDTNKAEFLASRLGRDAETAVEKAPYATYRIRPESGIGTTLSFKQQTLLDVGWAIDLPGETANDWSVESELRRKQLHDDWLLKELGAPPYRYAWGSIDSSYDDKGCASAIIVTYAR